MPTTAPLLNVFVLVKVVPAFVVPAWVPYEFELGSAIGDILAAPDMPVEVDMEVKTELEGIEIADAEAVEGSAVDKLGVEVAVEVASVVSTWLEEWRGSAEIEVEVEGCSELVGMGTDVEILVEGVLTAIETDSLLLLTTILLNVDVDTSVEDGMKI